MKALYKTRVLLNSAALFFTSNYENINETEENGFRIQIRHTQIRQILLTAKKY